MELREASLKEFWKFHSMTTKEKNVLMQGKSYFMLYFDNIGYLLLFQLVRRSQRFSHRVEMKKLPT